MADIKDYIAERLAAKDAELKGLQQQASQNQGMLGVAQGVGQAVAGLSRAGADSFNDAPYKNMQAQAEAPVANYLQRQKANAQATQEASESQNFNRKATLQDPTSVQSVIARRLAQSGLKKYGMDPSIVEGMSASDDFAQKAIESAETRQSREDMKKIQLANIKAGKDAKASEGQQKADSELATKRSQLGSRGGNAKYVDALRRADNIQNLINQYPDLNDMPPKQVNLLYAEIDGLVNGGAPTQGGMHGITPSSFLSGLSSIAGAATNGPVGAQLAPYISQMKPYIADVANSGRTHMRQQHHQLLSGYKGRLSSDAAARHQAEIEEEFPSAQTENSKSITDGRTLGSQPNTKMVNGKTYLKIGPNQWQEQ